MFMPTPPLPFDSEDRRDIAKAVVIAAASAAIVKLVEWGVEALKERVSGPTSGAGGGSPDD
jgi:hypothetical protein